MDESFKKIIKISMKNVAEKQDIALQQRFPVEIL